MPCDRLMFSGVDASKWTAVRASVEREYGIQIESEQGEQSRRGFTLEWAYDAAANTLRIQCTNKPFVVPCGAVNKRITGLADELGIEQA